jgi:uncharacterized protein
VSEPRGILPNIKIAGNGAVHVEGKRCSACGAIAMRETLACPSCGGRGTQQIFHVSKEGRLHSYSIVHRSFPGVKVPFVSAIVEMDDGSVLKGNLREVKPNPEELLFGMRVKMVFDDAGRVDREGNHYISYFFEPAAKE